MKKFLFSLFIISPFCSVIAQTPEYAPSKNDQTKTTMQRGQWFLGANGAGGLGRGDISNSDTWSATGQAGYFIADR